MKNYLSIAALAIAGLLGAPGAAKATTITLTGLGYYDTMPLIINGTTAQNSIGGQILATIDGLNLIAYCVDLFTSIGLSTYNTTFGDPTGISNGGRVAWLFNQFAPTVNSNTSAAALQLAIWDVVHDGGNGLTSGNVQLNVTGSATLRSLAESYILASVGQSSTNATILHNVAFNGTPAQNLITNRIIPPSSVPEPGTWMMTAAGLFLAAFGTRRRRS